MSPQGRLDPCAASFAVGVRRVAAVSAKSSACAATCREAEGLDHIASDLDAADLRGRPRGRKRVAYRRLIWDYCRLIRVAIRPHLPAPRGGAQSLHGLSIPSVRGRLAGHTPHLNDLNRADSNKMDHSTPFLTKPHTGGPSTIQNSNFQFSGVRAHCRRGRPRPAPPARPLAPRTRSCGTKFARQTRTPPRWPSYP